MKGKFIVIDGIDGSGKGTQTKLLVEELKRKGLNIKVTDFPQYGKKSAALVEEYLNGKFGSAEEVGAYRASIFYACDRYAASKQMYKWLEEGKIIISNRYVSANKGHQTGKIKDPEEREKFLDWLDNLEYNIFKIPKPDLVIVLNVHHKIGHKLVESKEKRGYIEEGKTKDLHEQDLEHLKNTEQAYLEMVEKYPNWVKVDCTKDNKILSREIISELIIKEVEKVL